MQLQLELVAPEQDGAQQSPVPGRWLSHSSLAWAVALVCFFAPYYILGTELSYTGAGSAGLFHGAVIPW
eukprot:COSAG06_NODE_44606_length_362_cov_0.593156_1_plen_68_part_10